MGMLDVTFVLPALMPHPCGGYLIVYQHAVCLSASGHRIRVVHVSQPTAMGDVIRRNSWLRLLSIGFQPHRIWRRLRREIGPPAPPQHVDPAWFKLTDGVEAWSVCPTRLPELIGGPDSAVVATAHETAWYVHRLPPCRKFYFIQDWETWAGNDEREVMLSWALPLQKLVISRWLRDLAAVFGDPTARLIPNVVDPLLSDGIVSPEKRHPRSLLFYHSPSSRKDWGTTRRIIERVLSLPDIQLGLLTATPPPPLPEQVRVHLNPPRSQLGRLYAEYAIFVHTSFMEGWGLPPMEALACGCACAMTDSLGVRDYLDEGHLMRLRPPGDVDGLVAQIVAWLADPKARIDAALAGQRSVAAFTWERSSTMMAEALSC